MAHGLSGSVGCGVRVIGVEGWGGGRGGGGGEMAVVAETLRGGVVVGG